MRFTKLRLRCLFWFVLLIVCGAISFAARTQTKSDGATSFAGKPGRETTQKYATWMSRVPDERPLSQLSIPGTHDTCALRNGASFGFAKCQSWSLEDQLEAGIRFIDIRCRHVGDRFHIYHGIVDQKMTFAKVQEVCRTFLKGHPTECIVMSVKEEHKPANNSQSFEKTFAAETLSLIHI